MQSKYVLKDKYGPSKEMQRLFVDLLGLQDATILDIVDELWTLNDNDLSSIAVEQRPRLFTNFYTYLANLIEMGKDESMSIPEIR